MQRSRLHTWTFILHASLCHRGHFKEECPTFGDTAQGRCASEVVPPQWKCQVGAAARAAYILSCCELCYGNRFMWNEKLIKHCFGAGQTRLRALLERPERVRALQEGVLHHQKYFLWDPNLQGGVYNNIEKELALRSAQRAAGETISVF